jgi:hypothetical protein
VITRAEAAALGIVMVPTAAIVFAYGADTAGLSLHPIPILVMSLVAATAAAILAGGERVEPFDSLALSFSKGELAQGRPRDLWAFTAIVGCTAAWLLWLAWPHLLPTSGGSDLTHHLLLIDYIDRARRLVPDPQLRPFLGDMIDYSPGLHSLAVLAGAWTRTSGLHTVYPLVVLSVALKTGLIFLIARRTGIPMLQALIAPLLLFLPQPYFLGSFTHDSFLAQVFSELFAVAMWWAIVCWDQQPSRLLAGVIASVAVATYLTWPVWLGPIVLTAAGTAWLHRERPLRHRVVHLSIAVVPVVAIAAFQSARRLGAASNMAGASGFALTPTVATLGWFLPAAGLAGGVVALSDRRARTIPLLLAAIALQAGVFFVVARASQAGAPYLTLKTFYLAIYPLAIGAAILASRIARSSPSAWLLVAASCVPAARLVAATPRPTPVLSTDLLEAGHWARAHVAPACVDYLTADDDTAYWLHLAVLGNARTTERSLVSDTFEPQKALVRWILPGGLPYAIASDFDTLPRDIRTNVDILARFGHAAVIKRRGATACQ